MNSQNFLYNGQSSKSLDGMEQGTWQPPTQNCYSQASQGQGPIYYKNYNDTGGAPQRYLNQNQSESCSNSHTSFHPNHASQTINSGVANYALDRSVGHNQTSSYMMGFDMDNSNSSSTTVCNSGYDGSNSFYYNYSYPSKDSSYNTSGNNIGMRQTAGSSADHMPGFSGFQKSSSYDEQYNYNNMYNGRGGLERPVVSDHIMMEMDGGNDMKNRTNIDGRKNIGSFYGESVGRDTPGVHIQNSTNLSVSSRGHEYKMRRGDFRGGRHLTSGNFGWRGRGSGRGHLNRSEPYHLNNRSNITLNATHRNQWGYHRKYFNKNDDELVEHLFEIHDLFCTKCQQREQEKKAKKGNTGNSKDKDPNEGEKAEEETPDEELTEEELQMRNVLGFSDFKSTKGSRLKDNMFETVSSVNQSKNDDLQESSTLTEKERRRILSIGGYSVFSNRNSQKDPEFGAPAMTMDPITNQEQNDSPSS